MSAIVLETRVTQDHLLHLPEELPINARVRIHIERLADEVPQAAAPPRTPLGRRLHELRNARTEADGPLLSPEALDEEMRVRRGGLSDG